MTLKEEIQNIHREYRKGNKGVKPSFRYIVELTKEHGDNGDFYVAKDLAEAQEKALYYAKQPKVIWAEIFEVVSTTGGYRAEPKFICYSDFLTFEECHDSFPMHVAWRTRGKLLNTEEAEA